MQQMDDTLISFSGRTFPEHSPQTEEKTSEQSSRNSYGSSSRVILFLDRHKDNGLLVDGWEVIPTQLLGESSMRNFGESPRDAKESSLSAILEPGGGRESL